MILVSEMQKGRTPRTRRKARDRQVNLRKLQKEEVRQEVETEVTKRLEEVDSTDIRAEEAWSVFQNTLTYTLPAAQRRPKKVKQTAWWNDTVKEAIKEKKLCKV